GFARELDVVCALWLSLCHQGLPIDAHAHICSFYCFFFYVYGEHWNIHSFPTRRSSDLIHVRGWAATGLSVTSSTTSSSRQWRCSDRKSTRLNSSHSQISYAVFCLKKKKNYLFPI